MKKFTLDQLLDKFMPFFQQEFSMDRKYVVDHYKHWLETHAPNPNNYLWYVFNHISSLTAKQVTNESVMWDNQWKISMKMWEFRKMEGEKGNDEFIQVHVNRIRRDAAQAPYKCMVKISSGHCCPYCDSYNGQIMEPQAYIDRPILATDKCTREWGCNCGVNIVPMRDKNDRLILKN